MPEKLSRYTSSIRKTSSKLSWMYLHGNEFIGKMIT
jgi:hypothetical protein